jgi:hypothetical protein
MKPNERCQDDALHLNSSDISLGSPLELRDMFPTLAFTEFCYAISVGGSIFSLVNGLTHSDRR